MAEKLLIFDFDGTIVDTRSLYFKAMEGELKLFGFSEDKIGEAVDIRLSLRKTLRNLGLNFVVSFLVHRRVLSKIKKYVNDVKKCKDVDSIKCLGQNKILVTNSLKEFALPVLKHLKLEKTFKEIYGADDFTDKADFISKYLKENDIKKEDCYYIGDRAADVRLARKVGCISVIVSGKCAWNPRSEIVKAEPDYLLADINEMKEIIK